MQLRARIRTLRAAWKGSCSSEPVMTMLGKSSRCTSRGSSIPFRDTMIRFGCSSTGKERTRAATWHGPQHTLIKDRGVSTCLFADMPHTTHSDTGVVATLDLHTCPTVIDLLLTPSSLRISAQSTHNNCSDACDEGVIGTA
jgi:hypothetical protein